MQINHLASVRFDGGEEIKKMLCDKIDEMVDAYVAGNMKHAAEAISLLWEVSKKDPRTIPAPKTSSTSVCLFYCCHFTTNTPRLFVVTTDRSSRMLPEICFD